jgi:hypothetical protein
MTSLVVSDRDEIREVSIDELDTVGGGERPPPDPKLVGTGLFPSGLTMVGAGVFHVAGIIIHE